MSHTVTPLPFAFVDWTTGALQAPDLHVYERRLADLKAIYRDQGAFRKLDPATVVYRVWSWQPVPEGTEGGLFWGVTEIQPGRVGDEYFMTRGHRHRIRNRAEFYGAIAGNGRLLLRHQERGIWAEEMTPGSLHYIGEDVAHRVVNTGDVPIRFIACWHSDAGHDYEIAEGFGACILHQNGQPRLVLDDQLS